MAIAGARCNLDHIGRGQLKYGQGSKGEYLVAHAWLSNCVAALVWCAPVRIEFQL